MNSVYKKLMLVSIVGISSMAMASSKSSLTGLTPAEQKAFGVQLSDLIFECSNRSKYVDFAKDKNCQEACTKIDLLKKSLERLEHLLNSPIAPVHKFFYPDVYNTIEKEIPLFIVNPIVKTRNI